MAAPEDRIEKALKVIEKYGDIDGDHHKAWVLDQVARELIDSCSMYDKWVAEMRDGEDGPDSYSYNYGIAP